MSLVDILREDIRPSKFMQLAQVRKQQQSSVNRAFKEGETTCREVEIQTEDFNFIDYESLTVQNAEIYMFDRISRKMKKIIVETD